MRINNLLNAERFYLTDGGLETFMIFEKGHELPGFSAAALLESEAGKRDLQDYYECFIEIARQTNRGFVMDAPTWRAGLAWTAVLDQTREELLEINSKAVSFVSGLRDRYETKSLPIIINGLVGPAGDAYAPDTFLSVSEAFEVHAPQVRALGAAGVDLISGLTLTYADEAIAITRAAKEIDIPVAIAFTLETNGALPNGQSLGEAIAKVDDATGNAPIYYMINCAHPDHFRDILKGSPKWAARIGGMRCNASRLSHAELDACETLDAGDPKELASLNQDLLDILPNVQVVGGCCGTDHRHVRCMAGSC